MSHPLSAPIRVALIEQQTLLRVLLKDYLTDRHPIRVVSHAPDVYSFLGQADHGSADIVVVSIAAESSKGYEAVRRLRQELPRMKVIVLSACSEISLVSEILDLGIYAYILKTSEPDTLIEAIRSVSCDKIYRNQIFADALYWTRQESNRKDKQSQSVQLTDRERQVLQLLWEEKSNKEIADQLYLGARSVEKIRLDIKEKLKIRTTIGLVKYAVKENIISIGEKAGTPGAQA